MTSPLGGLRAVAVGRTLAALWLVGVAGPSHVRADEVLRLCDFETPGDVRAFQYTAGTGRIVSRHATHGRKALEVTFDPKGRYGPAYLYWNRVHRDWSAYDALVLDVFNPSDTPMRGYLLVADRAWQDKGRTYWNRHNATTSFPPGLTQWVIPVRGLYRGEAGSRNNDIKRNIDPDSIVRVDFSFGRKGSTGRVIIDNLRLIKTSRPEGVWAFDFGPPSQGTMLGWTAVSNETGYTRTRGHGWGPRGGRPWNGAARDTTFGTLLGRDFCEAGGYTFHVDVPRGTYVVTVLYENSGYWGGEQARHGERRILAGGKKLWSESRPDGQAHALYRFEDVEPVGVDIWDTYMAAELARPAVFEADAGPSGLTLRFEADRVWGSKVAAVALHRKADAAAAKWLAAQFVALAREFRRQAVCLDPKPAKFTVPAEWQSRGLVAWPARIEADVTPNSVPTGALAGPDKLEVARLAVRGEYEPFSLAVRPLKDLGKCELSVTPFAGPGRIPASLSVVRYNTSRGFGNIAYRIRPHTLRPQTQLALPPHVARQVIVTVKVPETAPAGRYVSTLELQAAAGRSLLTVPLRLTVRPVTLRRDTEFLMGFFGLMPPGLVPDRKRWDVLEQTLVMLKAHGMNAVSGGPNWQLTGWRDGQPLIDFGETDRFFALLRKHGFGRPVNGYGGLRFQGLHHRYEKGPAAAKVAREGGLPYEQAFLRAWGAVDRHARRAGWPTIYYAMCDETRVREVAQRELDFMKLMAKATAVYPKTVRASGSYSVNFRSRPTAADSLQYWHQRFFEVLDISSLNVHDASVMAEARKLGKDVHIYNQGRTRYTFGLYQWSEFRKGVGARWQWHLNVLHGYQFFDLDGREPDNAMICYGRKGLYPTIHFERCREGAEDFYLYQTLWNAIERMRKASPGNPALAAATQLLAGMTSRVKLNDRRPPEGFDADAFKAKVIESLEALSAD